MTQSAIAAVSGVKPDERRRTVVDWFRVQVATRAGEPSMHFRAGGRWATVSWGQFGRASRRVGAMLLGEGIREHDHVGIWSSNRPEWHIADISILTLRVCSVPVYLTLSAEQAMYVLRHSESRVLFVENQELLQRVLRVRDQLPRLQRIVVYDPPQPAAVDPMVITWQEALGAGTALLGEQSAEIDRRADAVQPGDVATLIYTSGTTGPPKAVELTHGNLIAADDCLTPLFSADSHDRLVSYLPLAHIAERMASEFRSYRYGNATWFLDALPHLGETLREVRPTLFLAVPRVWEKMAQGIQNGVEAAAPPRRMLIRAALSAGHRVAVLREEGRQVPPLLARQHALLDRLVLSRLRASLGLDACRVFGSAAAPISTAVLRLFQSLGIEILEIYGQTENTAMATMNRPGKARIGTVGLPMPHVEVKLAEDGEIMVRGAPVFRGYFKDEDGTREVVSSDGWLLTGDVGEWDSHGYLRITDRKKDLIITAGGKNISPGNLQEALKQHRLIGNAIAIGDQRPFITALLTLDAEEAPVWAAEHGLPADLESLAQHDTVRRTLQAHVDAENAKLSHVEQVKRFVILPRDFQVGDELTPTMKLRRKVVLEKYRDVIEGMYATPR